MSEKPFLKNDSDIKSKIYAERYWENCNTPTSSVLYHKVQPECSHFTFFYYGYEIFVSFKEDKCVVKFTLTVSKNGYGLPPNSYFSIWILAEDPQKGTYRSFELA